MESTLTKALEGLSEVELATMQQGIITELAKARGLDQRVVVTNLLQRVNALLEEIAAAKPLVRYGDF